MSGIFLGGRKPFSEITGLSMAVGAGLTGLILFWISLAGLRPARGIFAFMALAILTITVCLWYRGCLTRIHFGGRAARNDGLWLIIPSAVVGTALIVICIHGPGFHTYEWDAFAIWGLKAKVLANASLRSSPRYFHDLSLSYSHLGYPLSVP